MRPNGHFDAARHVVDNHLDVDVDVIRLARGGVSAMPAAEAAVIRGVAGHAWVTQEGDAADVVLSAGAEFRAAPRGKIVVQALADNGAVLRVTRRGRAAPAPRTPTARRRRG